MAGLKFALGLIPDTEKIEKADDHLREEYKKFIEFKNSDELQHFYELEKEVHSDEFASRKKDIFSRKYKDTESYVKEKEYQQLEKSKPIRTYFKIKDSHKLKEYESFQTSDLKKRLDELESFAKSGELAKVKAQLSPKEYKRSAEAAREKEYIQLARSPRVKKNRNFEKSPAFKEYERVKNSDLLKRYKELKEFINTEKFKEFKNYMNLSGKKKYELSEEHKKEVEYKELKQSEKFQWYFKLKKKYPFKEIEKWELVFEDDFNGPAPDPEKWIFRYINGDKLIHKPYVLEDDIHAFADGKNVKTEAGHLSIITHQESGKSMTWSPLTGFTEKEFDYTSDLVSSARSFNTRYGLIKAKVQIGDSGVTQAFSLMAGQILPHVDIFKYDHGKLMAGNFWKNGNKKGFSTSLDKTGGKRYTKDYFIYSLEWSPEKLSWKINDIVFKEQKQGVPQTDMHLVFNASLKKDAKIMGLPSKMRIEWVRVYKRIAQTEKS
ncbi:MAG: family 16 glycosylhydrolase [Bacteroidota bacterium]